MLPVEHFTRFITDHHLFSPQSRVLAAVSGGKDSVLMAHLLKAAGYTFGIAHCNFQLRGDEALADEQFCHQLAQQLQVPFISTRFDTQAYARRHQVSIQMAARELRYPWFEQIRQQQAYEVIALAHHQNDTIETILLNLVRGTGIAGLHGILPLNGRLVRPMLAFTRIEIDEAVTQNQLPYREDSSNTSSKYARNKIRLEVIPKLRELNPGLEQTFQRNVEHFRELETLLQQQVQQAREQVFLAVPDNFVALSVAAIKQLSAPRLLLFELLKPYGFSLTTTDNIIQALDKHAGRLFTSATHQLVTDRNRLLLSAKTAAPTPVTLSKETTVVNYGLYQLSVRPSFATETPKERHVAAIDSALLQYPLTLRPWQQGDDFYPLGMTGRKKLSDFFINQKIPLSQKAGIPVLVNGNGELMWIAGQRLDNRYKITPQTEKVTIFELQYQTHE